MANYFNDANGGWMCWWVLVVVAFLTSPLYAQDLVSQEDQEAQRQDQITEEQRVNDRVSDVFTNLFVEFNEGSTGIRHSDLKDMPDALNTDHDFRYWKKLDAPATSTSAGQHPAIAIDATGTYAYMTFEDNRWRRWTLDNFDISVTGSLLLEGGTNFILLEGGTNKLSLE